MLIICARILKLYSCSDAMFVSGKSICVPVCPAGGKGRPGCLFVLYLKVTTPMHDLTVIKRNYKQ